MKRTMITTLCLVFLMVNSVFAINFKDVKESHWAYDAIENLVARGLITGFQDGSFKGSNKLSRYEYATLISKLIKKIESGEVKLSQLSTTELANLEKLVIEFADELSVLNSKVENHEERITALENAMAGGKKIRAKVVEENVTTDSDTIYDEDEEIMDEDRAMADGEWISNFDKKWSMYLGAGYFEPDSMGKIANNFAGTAAVRSSEKYVDSEVSFMGGFRYGIDSNWMIDFRYMNYDNDLNINATDADNTNYSFIADILRGSDNGTVLSAKHEMNVKPMTLTAYYYFNNDNRKFRPFVGLGGGIYDTELVIREYNSATVMNSTTELLSTTVNEKITGYHFAIGGEYWFNREWSIRGEGRFINADETFNLATDGAYVVSAAGAAHIGNAVTTDATAKTRWANLVTANGAAYDNLEVDLGGMDVSFSINYFFE